MRLFRAEEELPEGGASMPVGQLWALASAWYGDRLEPDWRPRTREASQAVLASFGLTDPFWELPR